MMEGECPYSCICLNFSFIVHWLVFFLKNISHKRFAVGRWKLCIHLFLFSRHDRLLKEVTIALVGKYTQLEDAYSSVIKSLQHSSLCCSHRLNLKVRLHLRNHPCKIIFNFCLSVRLNLIVQLVYEKLLRTELKGNCWKKELIGIC